MKKGFTLVELLAVIIILGVLSVLTVPKIVNTLNNSEEKTNMASANGLLKAAEYKYQDNEIKGISQNITIDYTTGTNTDLLDFNGKKPEKGKVQITVEGRISIAVKIGNKCYIKTFESNEIETRNYNSETCQPTKSFEEDSWVTIRDNLKFNRTMYAIGSEKEVEIDGTSYTVRLANTSSCPNDWPEEASQTTCGVVIEFADLITDTDNNDAYGHVMNSTATNVGGWPVSNMRSYLNDTLFNKLPDELKNEMILNTKVVSGHGSTSGENNFTTSDKLYLLSLVEVWGHDLSNDSVKLVAENINDGSRQLEYYSVEETRTIYKKDASGENASWWLRSADVETNNKFTFMFHLNAATGIADATWEYGVAPAFRILD